MGTPEREVIVCTHCDREIEDCSFCDERCGHELCWRCTTYELREEVPEPHGHGG
jgi:hypothetical protein